MKTFLAIVLTFLFLSSCEYNPFKKYFEKETVVVPSIVGSWELMILRGLDSEGHFQYPFDMEVKGFASFDNADNFSIQYFDATRPRISDSDPFFASDPDIRIAFLSGQSLFGKYRLLKDTIGMDIKVALNPNFSGTREKRYFRIKGDTMLMVGPGRNLNGIFLREQSIWLRAVQ